MGCLIFVDGLDSTQLSKFTNDLTGSKFFVNCTSDDRLFIWVRNANGTFETVGESALAQMKEWIRRKRV